MSRLPAFRVRFVLVIGYRLVELLQLVRMARQLLPVTPPHKRAVALRSSKPRLRRQDQE